MKAVVGVFKSRSDAEEGAAELVPLQIPRDRITILAPHASDQQIAAVPTVAGEQPGMGTAMGAAIGGAMGVAGGAGLVPMIVSLLIPGVGPVVAIGVAGGVILGALGAVGGGALGGKLEGKVFEGLPEDELYVYEDALRKGRSVVLVMAEDDEADAVRGALEHAGAESIDRAREMWWGGVRDAEKEKYKAEAATSRMTNATSAAASRPPCCTRTAIAPTKNDTVVFANATLACTEAGHSNGDSSAARNI